MAEFLQQKTMVDGGPSSRTTTLDQTIDSIVYEMEDKLNLNSTCPPDLINVFETNLYRSMRHSDSLMQQQLDKHVTRALISQDPCSLTDEERTELMRKKRKDDAYKTALCDSHRRAGMCNFGENCKFAHGVAELRMPPQPRGRQHPKFKTALCDNFSTTGYCKYGSRCQFIHKVTNPAYIRQYEAMKANGTFCSLFSSELPPMAPMTKQVTAGSYDMNQSMPLSSGLSHDVQRALFRAADCDPAPSRLARTIEKQGGYGNWPSRY